MTRVVYDYDPMAKVNGVEYALVLGDSEVWDDAYKGWVPKYVWVARACPDYTAPIHVARACDEYYQLGVEIEAAERAAGWDPNP